MSSSSRSPLHPSSVSPLKRKAMSVTQTYYLAHTARGKLSSEAARADHNLRLLVGHANLLDSLMIDLAEAEQEQESWFNQSVNKAQKTSTSQEQKHIQWADTIVEDPEEDWQAEDADSSDSDSEYDSDEDIEMPTLHRVHSHTITASVQELEEEEEDEEEDYASLQLHLTTSHSASPPELDHDSDDSSSDDESMPPSPPSTTMPTFSEKQRQQIATTSYYASEAGAVPESQQKAFFEEGFYLPQRNTTPGLVNAISAY
ncbi:hypothetical protein LHYA1_G008028 [Lachnellula hyalina]|uniref:Protein ECM13 n=1 Tax=Lachnellula hyalina TaxID=1316788 RepID=A0A8H8TXJ3_9HELO|nr:uncharacterized protein LHYA1_G008028 [Lachnellula hyalina]TVY23977.1 hypothetical protein LHYA1_G008028 [Lachnellula hyalina]